MRPSASRSVGSMLALTLLVTACGGGSEQDGTDRPSADRSSAHREPPPTAGERAVRRMTLRQTAGQVIVASWHGTGSPAPMVRRLHLGGVIALAENVTSAAQIRARNRSVAEVVSRRGYPAFLAVDQEGGLVNRVRDVVQFPAFMSTGAADDPGLTRRAARGNAEEMRRLGFDVVLAPVADVSSGSTDAVIGSRAAGGRPGLVARQVVAATAGIQDAGVLPVVKHFPGHGSLSTDSHLSLPVLRRSMEELRRIDLVPFVAAVEARAPAVLVGHIDTRAVDRGVPATISRKVTTGLLRDDLGFSGLVVTDALNMGGVQGAAPGASAAVRALRAGADVALMPPSPRAARDQIVRAVRAGKLSRQRLDQAAARMIDTLLGLQHRKAGTSAQKAARRLSAAALTSVAGPCSGRLIPARVRVVGPAADVARFDQLMAARGVTVAHDVTKRVKVGTKRKIVGYQKRWVQRRVKRDGEWEVRRVRRRVPVRKRVPVFKRVTVPADAPTVALVGAGARPSGAVDVLVALDRPGVLGRVDARVKLATYGDTAAAMTVLADALMGRRSAPGRLPVAVPGVSRNGC